MSRLTGLALVASSLRCGTQSPFGNDHRGQVL